jgi:ADP-ribose pyrophosphatase YjhB (NUDIX family)
MPTITVNVAVIHENRVLLAKRDDFEVWCLPGGGVENGESLAQAAVRETKEETGIDVELTSIKGVYSRIGVLLDDYVVLFAAVPIGGNIKTQPGETIDVRFFSYDEIPDDVIPWHRRRIQDSREGMSGCTVVTQKMSLPDGQKISLKDLVEARKLSRESRIEFFRQIIRQATFHEETDISK